MMKKLVLVLLILSALLLALSWSTASAGPVFQPAGYQSFYVLGNTSMVVRQAFDVALNLNPSLARPYGVFSLVSSQNASLVYVDQKYNGYTFDPNTFTGYDAVFLLDKGGVLTVDNWAAPYWSITPGARGQLVGGSLAPVDGGDYFFVVGGPVNVVRGFTDRQSGTGTNGTFVAEMTEVYPVEEGGDDGGLQFIIPVGENTPTTRDFNGTAGTRRGGTYAIVQAYYDGTVINYTVKGIPQSATLGRGDSMIIPHVHQFDTISASKKIQVVLFASGGLSYDTRFFNIPDVNHAGNDYWIPTFPSHTSRTMTIRYHIFAYTDADVTIERASGVVPGWNAKRIPAMTNDVSFTTNGTVPVHIYAKPGQRIIVLVSLDTNSPNYDWGYVPKDKSTYVNSYFIPFAPSGLGHPYDMQLFVLPLFDGTTILVDYNQDGVPEDSRTLNRFQAWGFYNPNSFDLTGTHIYSDFPFTVVYGESALADSGGDRAGFDWGYTLLPFDYVTYDAALTITKSTSPPVVNASGTVTFTLTLNSSGYIVQGIDVYDYLPMGFSYIPGSTTIVFANASVSNQDPAISGRLLSWNLNETMLGNSTMTITFSATASEEAGFYENIAYAVATDPWNNTLIPEAKDYLSVSDAGIIFGYVLDSSDPGSPLPVPGVLVSLYDGSGSLLGTALTDGNGLYKFLGLPAGTYRVAYDEADPDLGSLWPLSDSDPSLPAGSPLTSSAPFALPGGAVRTHDFNLSRAVIDVIKLDDPDPVTKQTILDGNHRTEINFTILYSVPTGAPATTGNVLVDDLGFFIGFKAGSLKLNGVPLTDALDMDAGDFNVTQAGAITVFLGALNPGDTGNVTWIGRICDCFFGDLLNNTAIIRNDKSDLVSSASSNTTVLEPPKDNATVFGTVQNIIYPFPVGIANLTISLYNSTSLVGTFSTTAIGSYRFENLSVGTYYVNYSLSHPAVSTLLPVSDTDGGAPNFGTVEVTNPSGFYEHDFNLTTPASVGGRVYVDWNMNGVFDAGDAPLAGASVSLVHNGVVAATTTTAPDGTYSFVGIMPGPYIVAIDPPTLYPYRPYADTDGGDADEGSLNLLPGESAEHSFGLVLRLPAVGIDKALLPDGDNYSTTNGIFYGIATFNITVTNTGNATLTNVQLVDTFNASAFAFVASSPYPDSVDGVNGILVWDNLTYDGALEPGASISITLTLSAKGLFPFNTTMNAATVTAEDEGATVSANDSVVSGPKEPRECTCCPTYSITSRFKSVSLTNGNGTIEALTGTIARVYSGTNATVNFTFVDFGCPDSCSCFTVLLYANGSLLHNSSIASQPRWSVYDGSFSLGMVSAPHSSEYRIELYRLQGGIQVLQDSRTFTLRAIVPALGEVVLPEISVESGLIGAIPWAITLTNTGGDPLYNISVAVPEVPGLLITPTSAAIDVLEGNSTKVITFMVTALPAAAVGERSVTFTLAFTDALGATHSQAASGAVRIAPLSTTLILTPEHYVVKNWGNVTLVARLTDANGQPLAGETVQFTLPTQCGAARLNATTNSSGHASVTYAQCGAGSLALSAWYAGRGTLAASNEAVGTVTVLPIATSISVHEPIKATPGGAITITALLTDENGRPLSGQPVSFLRLRGTQWDEIGTALTNSSGVATFTVTAPAGQASYGATFGGANGYASSSYFGATFTPVTDNTWIYILIFAVFILALLLAFLLSRRGRQRV